jgi:hypothetical protein
MCPHGTDQAVRWDRSRPRPPQMHNKTAVEHNNESADEPLGVGDAHPGGVRQDQGVSTTLFNPAAFAGGCDRRPVQQRRQVAFESVSAEGVHRFDGLA